MCGRRAARSFAAMDPQTFTPGRIAGLVLIAGTLLGLFAIWLAPGTRAVSLPAGADPGDLTLKPCDYSAERGECRADSGRWWCRKTGPARGGSRSPSPVSAPGTRTGSSRVPPGGRPGPEQHDLPLREPDRRPPRCRDRRLPRSRRLLPARLPRGLLGAAAVRRPPRRRLFARVHGRVPLLRGPAAIDGVDLAGYSLSQRANGLRPRARRWATAASTCSARAREPAPR